MRAAVMGTIFLSTWLVGRKVVLLNSVAAGAIVALLWDGHVLFQPGFQLSFTVLFAIAVFGSVVTKGLHWISYTDPFLPRSLYTHWQGWSLSIRRKLQGAVVVASCAWGGASPLTLTYFRLIAPISIIVSLPMVVLLYCILFSAGVSLIFGSIWLPFGHAVNQWNSKLASGSRAVVNVAANVPGGHVYGRPWEGSERVVIYALDDGGAAAYIGLGGGVMLDVGSSGDFKRKILPSLKRNVSSIDSLILSHADSQHCGGVSGLLGEFQLKQAVVPELTAQSSQYRRAVAGLNDKEVLVSKACTGQVLPLNESSYLEVISSPESAYGLADDRCLVLKLYWNGRKILFLSDSGYLLEQWIIENDVDVSADVIVLGEHERDFQVSADLLKRTGARLLVGANLEGYEAGIENYSLKDKGALTIGHDGSQISFSSYLRGPLVTGMK